MQEAKQTDVKVNSKDVFHVLSQENRDKTLLVIMPKSHMAKLQKHRLFLVTPDEQKVNPPAEALQKLNDLKAVCKTDFPKLRVLLPPLQLRSKAFKMAGPGSNPASGDKDAGDMSNFTHSFFLVASTDGLPEQILKKYGGAESLKQKQKDAINLMKEAALDFEKRRFYHPVMLQYDENTKKDMLKRFQKLNPNITWEEVLESEFESAVSKHENIRIISNLKPNANGPSEVGISLTSKSFYRPKTTPSAEDNAKCIEEYKETARKNKFTVNQEIVSALSKGLRHRRVPVFGLKRNQFEMLPAPLDPMKFHARGGDYCSVECEYHMYDAGTKGGTWSITQLRLVYQATKEMNQSFEADPEFAELPDIVDRFAPSQPPPDQNQKRKRDEDDQDGQQNMGDEDNADLNNVFGD